MNSEATQTLFGNHKIVFATDLLQSSRLALDYAVGFAHRYRATIMMVHAYEMTQAAREAEMITHKASVSRRYIEHRLESLATGVRRFGISVESRIEEGEPCDVLVQAVKSSRADLLVIGTHGIHRGLDHLLLGSNTEKIMLAAPCPTLTVGRHVMAGVDLNLRFNEILYVSDFSPEATAAGPYALLLGRDFAAPVDVCQLMPEEVKRNPELRQELSKQYRDAMMRILPDAEHYWCTPAFELDKALMASQVLKRGWVGAAGLIVLGVKAQSYFGRHLRTSFAYELVAKATCPILTVHTP